MKSKKESLKAILKLCSTRHLKLTSKLGFQPRLGGKFKSTPIITAANRFSEVLFPNRCLLCQLSSEGLLCNDCLALLHRPPRCPICAMEMTKTQTIGCPACQRTPPYFDSTVTLTTYQTPFDEAINRFKFHGQLLWATCFAHLMLQYFMPLTFKPDLIAVMPLSRERLKERGFNQSYEMAKVLARSIACPCKANIVVRKHRTPQAQLKRKERQNNTKDVFRIQENERTHNARIIVIDDVMTTGSSLNELAHVLKQAGASQVHNWIIARTPKN